MKKRTPGLSYPARAFSLTPLARHGDLLLCQYSVLVQGVSRIRVLSLAEEGPMLHGTVARLFDEGSIADAEVLGVPLGCPVHGGIEWWFCHWAVWAYTHCQLQGAIPASLEARTDLRGGGGG